jgi:hypothetical protein
VFTKNHHYKVLGLVEELDGTEESLNVTCRKGLHIPVVGISNLFCWRQTIG